MPSNRNKLTEEYWENRYIDGETGWDRGVVHPALQQWLEETQLTQGNVLIPGCGNGYEVLQLASLGFQVTAVDFADSPIKALAQKLGESKSQATLVQDDFFNVNFSNKFDAVYEQTCLCALEPSLRTQYENRLYDFLKPGGKLLVLFMQTPDPATGPPFHCGLEEMKKLFDTSRWHWTNEDGIRYEHPAGTIYELAFHLTKN